MQSKGFQPQHHIKPGTIAAIPAFSGGGGSSSIHCVRSLRTGWALCNPVSKSKQKPSRVLTALNKMHNHPRGALEIFSLGLCAACLCSCHLVPLCGHPAYCLFSINITESVFMGVVVVVFYLFFGGGSGGLRQSLTLCLWLT